MTDHRTQHIADLRKAFERGELGLYIGAGVSMGNGVPTWESLVLAMYFSAIKAQPMGGWRPFPNYLLAIAEWHLKRLREPLDVTARKIRIHIKPPKHFLKMLRTTLYAGYVDRHGSPIRPFEGETLRVANPTLDAVARLCERSFVACSGVRSVINYNYDELLETALGDYPYQTFWKPDAAEPGKMPIYHVHGFVPLMGEGGSGADDIVFTEEQYHSAAHNPYSWANLVQIQSMSRLVGLMVGLSLSDRNMRRLLDAITGLPYRPINYILLKRFQWTEPTNAELDEIHERAIEYREKFERSGVKGVGTKGIDRRDEIRGILREVVTLATSQQTFVLNQLGIRPIWYEEHAEIPDLINQIL